MASERTRTGIEIKNALTVKAVGYFDADVTKDDSGNITSVTFSDIPTISLGKVLHIGKDRHPYRINMIKEVGPENNRSYEMSVAKRTKASLFILPMLPGQRATYFFDKHLINCFIGTDKESHVIALLYRFSGSTDFIKFEEMLKGLPNFKHMSDTTKRTVLYVFDVPDEHLDDYFLFRRGMYSKFDPKYKIRILRFHNSGKDSTLGKILYRDQSRKKQLERDLNLNFELDKNAELYSIPDLEEETYDPAYYNV